MMQKTRREFLRTAALGAASMSAGLSCTKSKRKAPLRNILFIVGDDHVASVLGCYGNRLIRTPNLDAMAGRGVRFSHAFANAPVCNASRQSILTGKYPHACGVTLLRTSFPADQYTIAEHLKRHGFRTAAIGKMHFNNDLPHGFDLRIKTRDWHEHFKAHPPKKPPAGQKVRGPWRPFRTPARIWLNADMLPGPYYDADSEGTFYANKAVEFLQQQQNDRFCLWLGFHEPHSPFNFPIEYAGKYRPEDMPLPQGSPEDDRWIPKIFRDLSDKDKRGIIASYYTSVEYLDKNVGLILDALKATGLDRNTLVIYIGDQGYLLGDHKRFEKHTMWDPAIRAPLLMQSDGRWGRNRAIDALTEFIDLTPTMLDALGVPPMPELQGKSLLPVLEGKTAEHKDMVFCEFLVDNKAMVRTQRWKYIFTSGKRDLGQGYATGYPPPGITHRLYDLQNDPGETHNLAGIASYRSILQQLRDRMLEIFMRTHPKAGQLPKGLTKDEQLVWFCEPPDANPQLDAR